MNARGNIETRFLKQVFSKKLYFLFLPLLVIKYGEEEKEGGMEEAKGEEKEGRDREKGKSKEGREQEKERKRERVGGKRKVRTGERGKINRKSRGQEGNRKESLHCSRAGQQAEFSGYRTHYVLEGFLAEE